GTLLEPNRIEISVLGSAKGSERNAGALQTRIASVVEHSVARTILRMICARLGSLCRERTGAELSLYGDRAVIELEAAPGKHFQVSFSNTPDRQEFEIEAV